MNSEEASKAKRVLIVKLSSLGDLFHALPTVRGLKAGMGADVDWVVQEDYAGLVRCFTDVRRVIPLPRRGLLSGLGTFLAELRKDDYEYVIDLQGLLRSALVTVSARGRRKIGPSFNREGSRVLYPEVAGPMPATRRHAVDEAMDVVRYLGLEVLEPAFPLAFPRKPVEAAGPKVAFVPCSRWVTKDWPPASFVRMGQALQQRTGATVFLIGGPGDAAVCDAIAAALSGPVVVTCGRTTLVEMGSLLQEMDLVVGVDSGPMHAAAALGRPVVAVYCATNPVRTGPVGTNHRVITPAGLDCCPCHSRRCERGDVACLGRITPEEVTAAAIGMLGGRTA